MLGRHGETPGRTGHGRDTRVHTEDTEVRLYRDWAPSQFDTRGLGLPDRQDWIVAPVMRTRDSGPLSESNFASVLKSVGGESDTVEIHRFAHWGPGYFEILLVAPEHARTIQEITCALESYPILDESDLSMRESEAAFEAWITFGFREWLTRQDLSDNARDLLQRSPLAQQRVLERETETSYEGEHPYPNVPDFTRAELAALIRAARTEES